MEKKLSEKELLTLINQRLDLAQAMNSIENELTKVNQQLHINMSDNLIEALNKIIKNSNTSSSFIEQVFIRDDSHFIIEIFDALIARGTKLNPVIVNNIPVEHYIDTILRNDKQKFFKFLFHHCQGKIQNGLWDACSSYSRLTSTQRKERISLRHLFPWLQPHLHHIFQLHGEEMFKYARRGKLTMFVFFFLFQEHFTDKMFDTLLKFCNNFISDDYRGTERLEYLEHYARNFPDKYLNMLYSLKTLNSLN